MNNYCVLNYFTNLNLFSKAISDLLCCTMKMMMMMMMMMHVLSYHIFFHFLSGSTSISAN
jgi:hypothetical protein